MSNIALSWAFKCHVGNASAKAVLVYLADRADDDGTAAYPKIATIVNVTELSERTVRTALKTLQERGFIRRGDQRYARLGKGGRNRLPQYCQIVWDLAVESDPSTLEWIKETHTAEHDPKTMGNTVDPAASTIMDPIAFSPHGSDMREAAIKMKAAFDAWTKAQGDAKARNPSPAP